MEIKIVDLGEEEFKKVIWRLIDIYVDGYRDLKIYSYKKKRDIKRYLKWLFRGDPSSFFVGYVNGQLKGFIAGAKKWNDKSFGDISEIHEFVVTYNFRGSPLPHLLMEKILNLYQERTIGLWAGEKNFRAINFYKKYGFEEKEKVGIWLRMIREKK